MPKLPPRDLDEAIEQQAQKLFATPAELEAEMEGAVPYSLPAYPDADPTPRVIHLRASSAPLVDKCAASMDAAPGEVLLDPFDDTAQTGTDIHRAIALALKGQEYPAFEGDEAAENEAMVQRAMDWAEENIPSGVTPTLERHRMQRIDIGHNDILEVSGTIDLDFLVTHDELAVTDWKATYRDADHEPQLMIYAFLSTRGSHIQRVTIRTAYLRLNLIEEKGITAPYADAWMEEFIRNKIQQRHIYNPGAHCARCRRFASCEAVTAMNRKTVADLVQISFSETALNREVAGDLWDRVRVLERTIQHFREYVKSTVLADGDILLPNSRKIGVQKMDKKIIQPLPAWPLLEKAFTTGEMAKFISIGKGALEKVIGDRAAKGCKKKDQDAFLATLERAGAIVHEPGVQVKEMSAKEIDA